MAKDAKLSRVLPSATALTYAMTVSVALCLGWGMAHSANSAEATANGPQSLLFLCCCGVVAHTTTARGSILAHHRSASRLTAGDGAESKICTISVVLCVCGVVSSAVFSQVWTAISQWCRNHNGMMDMDLEDECLSFRSGCALQVCVSCCWRAAGSVVLMVVVAGRARTSRSAKSTASRNILSMS